MSLLSWLKEVFVPPARPKRTRHFYEQIQAQLLMLTAQERQAWAALLDHCQKATHASPTAKWTKEARRLFEAVGSKQFLEAVLAWFCPLGREDFENDAQLAKGLVLCTAFVDDERLSALLGDLGEASFKRLPGVGPVCRNVGNACVYVLGASSSLHATAQLSRLKSSTKFHNAKRMIDKAVTHAAAARGISKDALEELSAPSFEGSIPQRLGRWSPQLQFSKGALDLRWLRDDGKSSASVPAEVRRDHPEAAASLKEHLKRMENLLPGHVARLEHLFITDRALTLAQWRESYVEHGLVGFLARPLVWRFGDQPGLWFDGEVIDATGARLSLEATAEVRLWHPLGRSQAEVAALKALVTKLGVEQPIEQVDRQVFALTEIERASGLSMRWAGRRLKQHSFVALCRERGWRFAAIGGFDSYNPPVKLVPEWQLQVEFQVDAVDENERTPAYVFLYVATGQLRIHDDEGLLRSPGLTAVPAVVLSEVLRDVELFVTRCAG